MTALTIAQAETLSRDGIAALRAGDARAALARLEPVRDDAPQGFPRPWFLIAQACRMLGDTSGEEAALEALLAVETRHLAAMLMMGDVKARTGDDRAATNWYRAALNIAAVPGATVPPQLHPLLSQAQAFLAEATRRFAAHLDAGIAATGLATDPDGARLRQSLDLLLGRSELYLQQPSMFYFPGLPQRAFYERAEFAWLPAVEAATDAIRAELAQADAAFAPYVVQTAGRPAPANPLLDDPSWSALYLWRDGGETPQAARFPATMAALSHAPMPRVAGRSPAALFSRLTPGTHIQPHHGLLNTRLICHLPLVVPPGCALRVGAETRAWHEGETLIFDDSFEHEAWNRGDNTRTVLLFEIWRPEITETERAALARIFETIDTYQGMARDAG